MGLTALISFDPDFAAPGDWAAMYRSIGWQVVPANMPKPVGDWKFPALATWKEFQDELMPETIFDRWYGTNGEFVRRPNMGFVAGRCSGNVFVIDLDEYKDHQAIAWWRAILAIHNNGIEPETCQQVTGGGGRQLYFRARADWEAPTNRTTINVDIRGQGGFAMLPPSQHISGTPYAWKDGFSPWEMEIAEAPEWLLEAVTDLVAKFGGSTGKTAGGERTPSPEQVNAFGLHDDLREDYMTRSIWGNLLAWRRESPIKPTEAMSQARMADCFAAYEFKTKTRLPAESGISNADLLEREGRGISLFAKKWRRDFAQWDEDLKEEALKPKPNAPTPSAEVVALPIKPVGIPLLSAFPIAETSIPPRDWIIPGLFLKRHLSVLVAPPGSGKSLLTLQLAIAVALGMSWGGWKVRSRKKVLVVNSEDDVDEMRRRLLAATKEMKVKQEDLVGWLFLAEAPESIVIAKADPKTKTVVRTPLVEDLILTIQKNDIECTFVDPFAETFEGDENSNSEIKWAGILWREVARRTGASVMLVHHTKKYAGAMAGDADASRGGGALIGTARILSTLFAMTEEEAGVMNVQPEDRTKYVRFDDAKANLSLVTGQAKWFEKKSITLNNSKGFIPGDEVGVLSPWEPPGMFEGVSMHTIGQILDTIDRGLLDEDGLPTGQFYTMAANGANKDRWAGTAVRRLLGCEEKQAKRVLKEWQSNEVLETFEYVDPIARKSRTGVRSIPNNRPDRTPK